MKFMRHSVIFVIVLLFSFSLLVPVKGDVPMIVHYQLSQIATAHNNVFATYQENGEYSVHPNVFFRMSQDGGITFDNILQLNDPDHMGANPLVASSSNNVYVAWMDQKDYQSPTRVLLVKSTDGGDTFSSPVILSNNTENSGVQQLLASGNNVYVLMIDELKGDTVARISFRASHDNGTTFENQITLLDDTQTRGSVTISLSEDGKAIYAAGEDSKNCPIDATSCNYQIFLKKSTDFGMSFGDPVIVKNMSEEVPYLQISNSKNNVYLVWGENSTIINFVHSNDAGTTFSRPVNLSKNNTLGESTDPRIASDENNVYVDWENNAYNHPSGLYFTRSIDGGNTFSTPTNLTGDIVHVFSDMVSSNKSVYITWMNRTTDKWDVFFTKSNDAGTTFDNIHNLTGQIRSSFNVPQVVSDKNNVYVAFGTWYPGNDIFLVKSSSNGSSFDNIINLNHYGTVTSPRDLIHIKLPLQQYRSGLFAKDTSCNPYLTLIFKAKDGTPACVEPDSVEKLVQRGWAMTSENTQITHMNLQVFGSYNGLEGNFLKGYLNAVSGPISNGSVTVSVNGTMMGTAITDPGGCFQFNKWDQEKISKQIDAFAELDKTRFSHVPAILQFDVNYLGDENHNPASSTSYSYLYLYAVPLAPSKYDTSILSQEINVTKSFGVAQIQVSVKPIFKDSEVSHMKLYLGGLPFGRCYYEIKRISNNDTASLTHPAIFNFTMHLGGYTPLGKYFVLVSQNPNSIGGSDLDVGGFILNILQGN